MARDANGTVHDGRPAGDPRPNPDDSASADRPLWKDAIRTFSPAWFTPTMGTGVTGTALRRLPYWTPWLHWPCILLLALAVLLFGLATVTFTARLVFWPSEWAVICTDETQLGFLGAAAIGLGSIVSLLVYICVEAWGPWAARMAWALWMVDAVLALAIVFLVPFVIVIYRSSRGLTSMTATQLMPVAGILSASLAGSTVAPFLPSHHARWTIVTSYALWGVGMLGTVITLTNWYQRLYFTGLPPRQLVPPSFLPVATLCLGAVSVLQLGEASRSLPTPFPDPDAPATPYVLGVLVALTLWGAAIVWLAFAVAFTIYSAPLEFDTGWWEFTFPPGMLALTTMALGKAFSAKFFSVLGTIIAVAETLVWIFVALGTAWGIITGRLLNDSRVSWWESRKTRALAARRKRDEEA